MNITLPVPRLLPLTMLAVTALLCVKTLGLLHLVMPGASTGAAQAAEPAPPASPAAATSVAAPEAARTAADKPAEATAPAPSATAIKPEPPISDIERTLLLDLRKRRAELDARDSALAARDAMLSAAQARLATRVEELGGLQKRLEALEASRAEHDEANWRSLVKLYETMKPKDAAVIFNDLDPSVLLPVLDRMKESKVAAVFAAMLPDRARTATIELAKLRARNNTIPPAAAGG